MKVRSRVAALAAVAGLAAGMLVIGGGGTAHAATFLDCDRVSGTGAIKPALSTTAVARSFGYASPKVPTSGQYPRTCTGTLAATTGPLVSVKAKLAGTGACSLTPPATPGPDPTDGKLDLTWTNIVDGKALKSSTYIRLGAGATPDTFELSNGIVTKGPGLGMDVDATLLQAPVITKGAPVGSVYSSLAADGTMVPGTSSIDLGLNCVLAGGGTPTPGFPAQPSSFAEVIFSTDGTSLTGTPIDSSLAFTLPE